MQAYSARFGMSEVAVELAVSTVERFPAILSAIIIAVGQASERKGKVELVGSLNGMNIKYF